MNNGGPAFPHPIGKWVEPTSDELKRGLMFDQGADGMTLRDYFAAAAVSVLRCDSWSANPLYWEGVAKSAYTCADAMLKERDK